MVHALGKMRVDLSKSISRYGFQTPLGAVAKSYGTKHKGKRLVRQLGECHGAKRNEMLDEASLMLKCSQNHLH